MEWTGRRGNGKHQGIEVVLIGQRCHAARGEARALAQGDSSRDLRRGKRVARREARKSNLPNRGFKPQLIQAADQVSEKLGIVRSEVKGDVFGLAACGTSTRWLVRLAFALHRLDLHRAVWAPKRGGTPLTRWRA